MHPSEGDLRAYLDHEMEDVQRRQVQAHLASCPVCQVQAEALAARARRVSASLSLLEPDSTQAVPSLSRGRASLELRLPRSYKEHETMLSKLFSRQFRPAWAVLAVVTVLAVSLAFPPVRALAGDFLGLFRVQKVAVVSVNPANMPSQLGRSAQFETMMSKNVKIEGQEKPLPVADVNEAAAKVGFNVRLPSGLEEQPKLAVNQPGQVTFDVDLALVRGVLEEIGRADIQLPDSLQGAQVSLKVPSGVLAQYGKCEFDAEAYHKNNPADDPDSASIPRLPNCTTLLQMPSPIVSAPPDLNITQLGQAYLQVMGLSREEAESFASNVDWTSTLVIPVPRYGANYQDVVVDGVNGVVLTDKYLQQYMLIWVKDGIVMTLTGPGDVQQALGLAATLK